VSSLKVRNSNLENVLIIEPATIYEDFRGSYVETYNEDLYQEAGIDIKFVQDDVSTSAKNVLRGIHGDAETYKLISCPYGRIYLVIVNCDTQSKNFGQWESFSLSAPSKTQILAPPKHGVAHLVLSDVALFSYKQSTYYNRAGQFSYRYDDSRFGIFWPTRTPILSERDSHAEG
jgi:dTDP-4-dehydrorhamnose 3,5-epimerase